MSPGQGVCKDARTKCTQNGAASAHRNLAKKTSWHGGSYAHARSHTAQRTQRRACNARSAASDKASQTVQRGIRTVILVLSCEPRSSHTKNSSNTTARQLGSCTRTETRNRHELRMGNRGIIKWRQQRDQEQRGPQTQTRWAQSGAGRGRNQPRDRAQRETALKWASREWRRMMNGVKRTVEAMRRGRLIHLAVPTQSVQFVLHPLALNHQACSHAGSKHGDQASPMRCEKRHFWRKAV
jgi:hypothetical protein